MKINQIKAGAILSYVIIAVNNIVGLLYTPFMLRMMGQNEYGLYSLASSIVAYLTVLDLGFNNAIIRYTAKYRAEGKIEEQYKMFGMFFSLYCIISLIVIFAGMILYCNIEGLFGNSMTSDDISKVKVMVVMLIANLAFTFPMSLWGGIITAYEDFVFQKIITLARVILNPLAMIFMLILGYRAIGMVFVITLFNIASLSINAIYCFKKLHIRLRVGRFQWGFLKEVSVYSFWIFLSAIVDRLYWGSGQFILGIFRSTVEIAVYAVAIQMQSFYTSFSYAISSLLLPKTVKLVTNKEPVNVISDFFIKISRIQFYPIGLILFAFIVFGKKFIIYWAGSEYELAYYMSTAFMVPQLFTTMQQTGYTVLQAQNRVKFRALSILLSSVLAILISIPISKYYGGIGVSMCIAFGLFFGNLLILNIYYYKVVKLNMKEFWKETLKLSVWPVVFSTGYYFLMLQFPSSSLLCFILNIVAYATIYITGCVLFSFNEYEKQTILKPVRMYIKKFLRR